MQPTSHDSSRSPALRLIGVVYLAYFVTAALGLFLTSRVVSPGDAAATATALQAREAVFRAGLSVTLVSNGLYIAVTAFFYRLFEPVNRNVSLIAAFLSLAGCTVQIAGSLFQLGALALLADGPLTATFTGPQLQAASLFSLGLVSQTFSVSLVLFAAYDLLLGALVVASGFVPKALGLVLMLAGVGWSTFLWPPLAKELLRVVMPLGALAEIALMTWLIIGGAGHRQRLSA